MNYVRPLVMIWEKVFDFLCVSATQMFQAPNMIVTAIAATGMYRSVDNLVSPRETPRGPRPTVLSDMRIRTVPLNQTEVSGPSTEYGQYPTSRSGSGSHVSTDPHDSTVTDPHERYKAHEVRFNVDVESCPEK
jgi:hypothetical protein